MSASRYIVGIDLGTTNCAVAYASADVEAVDGVRDFPIPQLERPGQVAALSLLPSALYVPSPHELPPGATALPWGPSDALLVGEFARWQGARVPGRLVSSAKSWLCHDGVDRSAAILPWGAPPEVAKVSPTEATARLLAHLVAAWNHAHPDALLGEQEVVITVPASFDEVARALTVAAAQQAGLQRLTLVEEPQAAFYDFTAHHPEQLAETLRDVRLVLVVDVGGGTTDFTLIAVQATETGPDLRRIAVGDHLMLGGDNMDAALARRVETQWVQDGRKLNPAQWLQLVQSARGAKEALLGATPAERHGIAVVGAGSRLLAGTLSAELGREETEAVILDGFFPVGTADEVPRRGARGALQELGLPYAQDAAITRHLAAFLRQHAAAAWTALGRGDLGAGLPRPDAILLNGGVFNSPKLTARLRDVLSSWWPDAPSLRLLPHHSLELAVARGAAHYGRVRHGWGRRIGGGAAHAFYVGLAGESGPRAVCLIPRGQEEGAAVDLNQRPFELALGQPVQFPLYTTSSDRADRPGDLVSVGEDFRPLPPIHTVLKSAGISKGGVPVHLRATITEVGTLELWCVAQDRPERWRLEFELRGAPAPTDPAAVRPVTESLPRRFADAQAAIQRVYGSGGAGDGTKEARQLGRTLEQWVGSRETWRAPVLRELWSLLHAGAKARRRSVDHERAFYQLAGYTLRPGYGYPLDAWRCEQMFPRFTEGVTHRDGPLVWNDFWILWRRLAGGLTETQQQEIYAYLKPHLARRILPHKSKSLPKPKGVQPEGLDEMVRLAAALEQIGAGDKMELGHWIVERLKDPTAAAGPWAWALGRLGAREPLHGSPHRTVPAAQAAAWLSFLLGLNLRGTAGALFAVTQLARRTGDRARDVDDALRDATLAALRTAAAPERWQQMVREVVELDAEEEAQALGDSLPLGLRLEPVSVSSRTGRSAS